MKRTSLLMLVLAVAAFLSSYAEPPMADIEAAKSAVEAARAAEAPNYATAELNGHNCIVIECTTDNLKVQVDVTIESTRGSFLSARGILPSISTSTSSQYFVRHL